MLDKYAHIHFSGRASESEVRKPNPKAHFLGESKSVDLHEEEVEFFKLLTVMTALDFSAYRPSSLQRRLPACLRALKVKTVKEAIALIETKPALVSKARDVFLIGTTSFFRDGDPFFALKELLTQRPSTTSLNVLSIGCSDGAELYSVALLLDELNLLGAAKLKGLDIRGVAIAQAKKGKYPLSYYHSLDQRYKGAFDLFSNHCEIKNRYKERLTFEESNSLHLSGLVDRYDLIICRNIVLYLVPEVARKMWHSFSESLGEAGLLMVGKAERPPQFVRVGPCLYRT